MVRNRAADPALYSYSKKKRVFKMKKIIIPQVPYMIVYLRRTICFVFVNTSLPFLIVGVLYAL